MKILQTILCVYVQFVLCTYEDVKKAIRYSDFANNTELFAVLSKVHQQYCPATSTCPIVGSEVAVHIPHPCCADCSCADDCTKYGNCCPALIVRSLLKSPETFLPKLLNSQTFTCALPRLKPPQESEWNEGTYWFINKCNPSYADPDIVKKCEDTGKHTALDALIPVYDRLNKTLYLNQYCYKCNFVPESQVIFWRIKVECKTSVILTKKADELLDSVKKYSDCNMKYQLPENIFIPADKCGVYTISECNVTGHWKEYNRSIEAACHSFTSVYKGKFRNVFCYMCNYEAEPEVAGCAKRAASAVVSFAALLDFNSVQTDETDNLGETGKDTCTDDYVFDAYKSKCRRRLCSATRELANGTCQAAYGDVLGLCYQVFIKFTPKMNNSSLSGFSVHRALLQYVNNFINSLNVRKQINLILLNSFQERTLYGGDEIPADIMPEDSSYYIYVQFSIDLTNTEYIEDQVLTLNNQSQIVVVEGINVQFVSRLSTLTKDADTGEFLSEDQQTTLSFGLAQLPDRYAKCLVNHDFITIAKTTTCILIELSMSEFSMTSNGSSLYIKEVNLIAKPGEYILNDNGNSVFLCEDAYLPLADELVGKMEKDKSSGPAPPGAADYFSLVCTIISIICLCFTIFTYLTFRVIQTQPGMNNVALSFTLLCAQSFFQFGAGQAKNVSADVCTSLGIFIHFFWLMALFWMSSCSIHMFLVFRKMERVESGTWKKRTLVKYCLYCVAGSLAFVIVNIIYSSVHYGDGNIGYGGNSCYITDNLMIGIAFALPVGLIIVTNLVLFLNIVVTIQRIPTVQSTVSSTRNYFGIYARLSTITGLTWIFGFLFVFTRITILEYFFIFFNAGQGVFIMIAFVCNGRVRNLYKEKYCKSRHARPSKVATTKTSSKQAKTESVKVSSSTAPKESTSML